MAEDNDLSEAISETAKGPASVSIDGNTTVAQKITDQIEADRYLASKNAMKAGRGVRFAKLVPHGAQ